MFVGSRCIDTEVALEVIKIPKKLTCFSLHVEMPVL
jgi:hypothetical protein